MVDNQNVNSPNPEDLRKVREYLYEAGLRGQELVDRMEQLSKGGADFSLQLRKANEEFRKTYDSFDDLSKQIKNVIKDLKNQDDTSSKISKSYKSLESTVSKLKYDQDGINRLGKRELESLQQKLIVEQDSLKNLKQSLEDKYKNASDDLLSLTIQKSKNKARVEEAKKLLELRGLFKENGELNEGEENYLKRALNLLQQRIDKEKKIIGALGLTGKLVDGIIGSLGKLGISSEFFEGLKEDMRNAADSGSKWKVVSVATVGVMKGLKDALKDPLTQITLIYQLFKSLVTSALNYQKAVFEASKNLGLNVKESEKLVNNFNQTAIQNTRMALTSAQMIKTYQELSDKLGVMTVQDEEFLATSSAIMRNLGITAEQMESIQLFAVDNKKTVNETLSLVVGTAKVQGARLKISMTEKQIMDGISKVSATVFNNFKGNVIELSKAVVQATKFGTTLDQINQAGMQFLEFESSISKEFEAQLLTGKQIDLTMARQYALTGETEKLMGEITRQLGTQADWNSMNVIKQQSLAEAMGLNKEAVDEMFKKQQLVSVLGENASKSAREQYEYLLGQKYSHEQIVKLMGEEATNNALQASAQDKLTAAMENMRLAVSSIADAFLPITSVVNGISGMMNKITGSSKTLAVVLSSILGYYVGIKTIQGAIYLLKQRQLIIDKAAKVGEIMSMRRATFKAIANAMSFGGPVGLILAGIVGASLAAYAANLGVESVGSSVAIPNSPSDTEKEISPMNPATAAVKATNTSSNDFSKPAVYVNITDNSRFDPVKPNQIRDFGYNINNVDGKTGPLGR